MKSKEWKSTEKCWCQSRTGFVFQCKIDVISFMSSGCNRELAERSDEQTVLYNVTMDDPPYLYGAAHTKIQLQNVEFSFKYFIPFYSQTKKCLFWWTIRP